ncbi:MAG: DUF1349 domain-containing protein [Bacteroidota bacterium]|nr:DUF1349 domain-containing protein [Bacteroidota bacterium]
MKGFLLSILIVFACSVYTQAQEVKISSVPYTMHFENKAQDYKILSGNSIQIAAPAYTDLFISPDGGFKTNRSPRLVFTPDSGFTLSAKIKPAFKSKWDAGVLMIFNDSTHFAKLCFEYDIKGQPRVVSVVCNEVADDCNSMAVNNNEVYFRITGSTKDNTFTLSYLEEGKGWLPIRSFRLNKTESLQIGLCAQSPTGKGCKVDFTDINYLPFQ